MSEKNLVSVTRLVPAPPAAVFELLARPARHGLIDGSGSVRGVQPRTPERLSAGARFGMEMKIGVPYRILNTVVEFDEGRQIAWRHFFGHVWRYRLEPAENDQTFVTEEFDGRPSRSPAALRLIGAYRVNRRSIERTLDRLEEWARAQG